MTHIPLRWKAAGLSMALVIAGCGDDGGGSSENLGDTGPTTSSTAGAGAAVSGCKVESGSTNPSDEQVVVTLGEWVVKPSMSQVKAGTVSFIADNAGAEPHELVIVRGENAAALPTDADGAVAEDKLPQGALVGEIEEFAAGQICKGAFTLTAGSYVLLCNIVETEPNGEKESHFKRGMHAPFTVT